MELAKVGLDPIEKHCAGVFDTLSFAKEQHPGKRNSLDALCERYFIDNSHRTLHGALLDATLLGEVYLAMTRGQDSLAIELETPRAQFAMDAAAAGGRLMLVVLAPLPEELAAHEKILEGIQKASKGKCLWRQLELEALPDAA
jgi:DNA polymerase-3 subunit epsilon